MGVIRGLTLDYRIFYRSNKTYISQVDDRLRKIIKKVEGIEPRKILDIGCGNGLLIRELKKRISGDFFGVDVYEEQKSSTWHYKSADITKGLPYGDNTFDCVIMGEVIEHLPDPDYVLSEIYRVTTTSGYLVLSTPNLVSWANRLLVPLGIQPLYTETSTKVKLGRRFKSLGQGSDVQGHLKIFTSRSLKEILILSDFEVVSINGAMFFFPFPLSLVDNLLSRFVPVASNLIVVARK